MLTSPILGIMSSETLIYGDLTIATEVVTPHQNLDALQGTNLGDDDIFIVTKDPDDPATAKSHRLSFQQLVARLVPYLSGGTETFSDVAFSGDYGDLVNVPSLFSGDYGDLVNAPSLATVATSGAYADLTGKPVNATDSVDGLLTAADFTKLGVFDGKFRGSYDKLIDLLDEDEENWEAGDYFFVRGIFENNDLAKPRYVVWQPGAVNVSDLGTEYFAPTSIANYNWSVTPPTASLSSVTTSTAGRYWLPEPLKVIGHLVLDQSHGVGSEKSVGGPAPQTNRVYVWNNDNTAVPAPASPAANAAYDGDYFTKATLGANPFQDAAAKDGSGGTVNNRHYNFAQRLATDEADFVFMSVIARGSTHSMYWDPDNDSNGVPIRDPSDIGHTQWGRLERIFETGAQGVAGQTVFNDTRYQFLGSPRWNVVSLGQSEADRDRSTHRDGTVTLNASSPGVSDTTTVTVSDANTSYFDDVVILQLTNPGDVAGPVTDAEVTMANNGSDVELTINYLGSETSDVTIRWGLVTNNTDTTWYNSWKRTIDALRTKDYGSPANNIASDEMKFVWFRPTDPALWTGTILASTGSDPDAYDGAAFTLLSDRYYGYNKWIDTDPYIAVADDTGMFPCGSKTTEGGIGTGATAADLGDAIHYSGPSCYQAGWFKAWDAYKSLPRGSAVAKSPSGTTSGSTVAYGAAGAQAAESLVNPVRIRIRVRNAGVGLLDSDRSQDGTLDVGENLTVDDFPIGSTFQGYIREVGSNPVMQDDLGNTYTGLLTFYVEGQSGGTSPRGIRFYPIDPEDTASPPTNLIDRDGSGSISNLSVGDYLDLSLIVTTDIVVPENTTGTRALRTVDPNSRDETLVAETDYLNENLIPTDSGNPVIVGKDGSENVVVLPYSTFIEPGAGGSAPTAPTGGTIVDAESRAAISALITKLADAGMWT